MKTLQLKKDLFWAGILDKDLRVFDIIMHTEFGTTYNSYILQAGDKKILFETAKAKFYGEYQDALQEQLDCSKIDYIVVDHTEPDHAGSIVHIIEQNPKVKIIATATAISFLQHIINKDFYSIAVKNGDELKIGDKTLRFYLLPNLHWPDTMYTYIVEDKVLMTCDSFGSHYAHDGILRSTVTDYEGYLRATKYYFDNILGPFKDPYMKNALEVVKSLEVDMICPGHGPVLDSHIPELLQIYDAWCQIPVNEKPTVVIPYVSAYGYTEQLAGRIAEGIREAGDIEVKCYDMVTADAAEVAAQIGGADGILFGTPTILQEALKPIWDLTTGMYPPIHGGKAASAFGSFGWSGEGVPHIIERLKQVQLRVMDGFRVRFKPSEKELEDAVAFGYRFALHMLQKQEKPSARGTLVKCAVCGEIFDSSVETCPVCGVGAEYFVPVADPDTGFRLHQKEKFVIIGGGAAALNAAKAIRLRSELAEITMISEEKELPYDRPQLTKRLFGAVSHGAIASEAAQWYEENNIQLLLGSRAERIDTEQKQVVLADGSAYPYDKCIYALGSSSFIPPFTGKDLPEVVAIRSIADVEKVNALAENAKAAVVIGGGVLGLEAAWELHKVGLNVTVLEAAPVLMAGKVDAQTADMLIAAAAKKGISIQTGVKIDKIDGAEHVDGVLLADGTKVPADMVIVSTGVRANIALAQAAGIKTDRAVIVDAQMQTSAKDVYAAGDCAEFTGKNITLWSVAADMGRIAGANAAGEALSYQPEEIGMTFHGIGTALFAIGDVGTDANKQYKVVEIRDDSRQTLERVYFYHDVLCGAVLLGDTSRMMKLAAGVKERKTFQDVFCQ